MTMNPLPPQAYTKETMLKAYQWLMGQNSSIKEMATTPDILVSLYLKATRDGNSVLDRPSIQNFKNELKSLAGMMGELDRPERKVAAQVPTPAPAPVPTPAPTATPSLTASASAAATTTMTTPAAETNPVAISRPAKDIMEGLDCCTKDMIQEVKVELNLSSELEALRMLVKIGYGRAKELTR